MRLLDIIQGQEPAAAPTPANALAAMPTLSARTDGELRQGLVDYLGDWRSDAPRPSDYPLYALSQAARALTPHSNAPGWSHAPRGYGLGDLLPGSAGRYAEDAENRVMKAHPETTADIERRGGEFSASIPYSIGTGPAMLRPAAAAAPVPAAKLGLGNDLAAVKLSPLFRAMKSGAALPEHPKVFNKLHPGVTEALEKKGISRNSETNFLRLAGVIERTPEGWALTDKGRAVHGLPPRDDPAVAAQTMRRAGASNAEVHEQTGLVFSPAGELLKELPDTGAVLDVSGLRPGQSTALSDILQHAELYAQRPELAGMPIRALEKPWSTSGKIGGAVTDLGGGTLGISVSEQSPEALRVLRATLLKRLQQDEPGLSMSGRHLPGTNTKALAATLDRVGELQAQSPDDPSLTLYRNLLSGYSDKVAAIMAGVGRPARETRVPHAMRDLVRKNSGPLTRDTAQLAAEGVLYPNMTGNALANIVRARALHPSPPENPFAQIAVQGAKGVDVGAAFKPDRLPLPPPSMTDEELLRFVRNWAAYGGRP